MEITAPINIITKIQLITGSSDNTNTNIETSLSPLFSSEDNLFQSFVYRYNNRNIIHNTVANTKGVDINESIKFSFKVIFIENLIITLPYRQVVCEVAI